MSKINRSPELKDQAFERSAGSPPAWRRWVAAAAGPVVIVSSVLAVLHSFAVGGRVSSQHPDILAFWLPNYCFLGKTLASAHVPAWNPFVMGGVPFAADPQSGWMYFPAMALFSLVRCDLAIRWMIVLQPILAGLGLYWFLRNEKLSRVAASTGGLVLSLGLSSSRLAVYLPFPSALAWTALLLAACSRYLSARTWAARLVWCLLTAAAWGQLAAAYFAQGLVIGTLALIAYVTSKSISNVVARKWTWGQVAALAGLLLASFPLVNLAFLLPRIAYLPRTSFVAFAPREAFANLLRFAWPLKFSTIPGMYLGAVPLALSFGGWWLHRQRSLVAGFTAFGAVGYLIGLRPFVQWIAPKVRTIPLLRFYAHFPGRYSVALLLALPVLAAVGVDAWRQQRKPLGRAMVIAPGILIWWLLPGLMGAGLDEVSLLLIGAAAGVVVLILGAWRRPALALLPLVVVLEVGGNGFLGQLSRPHPFMGGTVRDPFGASVSGWFTPLNRPRVDAAAYVRAGSIVRALRSGSEGGARYLSLAPDLATVRGYLTRQMRRYWGLLSNERSVLFGLQDIQGYNPVQLTRYWIFVRAGNSKPIDYNAAVLLDPAPLSLDLLQVGYIVAPAGRSPVVGAVEVTREGRWALYRLTGTPSRATVVTSWVLTAPAGTARRSSALRAILAPDFDPNRVAVLEAQPAGVSPPLSAPSQAGPIGMASYEALGNQAARVVLDAPRPGLLVIRTPYDSGWHATVDDARVPVYPADYLVQAVAVPAGKHVVKLFYSDPSIGYGILGSGVALSLLLGAAFLCARRDLKPRSSGSPEVRASPELRQESARPKGIDRGHSVER